ncbi:fatty acid cis/trans isomerase [Pseudoalteromonas sp. T1lg10]|uniref:fatty acid cis/trans isomerase n=1 Tax=Pseudoalteromonas sp. T1lg10 TaxID=2077093 RepID=UPI000CF6F1CC|nr:fatty acid cis/trans isomerase [Pseudoalteromonas sp. T1lg10]
MNKLAWMLVLAFCTGCAVLGAQKYDSLYGQQLVENRQHPISIEQQNFFQQEVKPIIDNRCVVCHGCYDAPCQLKMSSPEGIERGTSKDLVYDGTRLLASEPSRLFIDAHTTAQWRDKGFNPVLNERQQSPQANLMASVMYRSLALKQQHPLPEQAILGEEFDFSLDRQQSCPTIEEFEDYALDNPLAGMPYGLPALNNAEMATLTNWLQLGAPLPDAPEISAGLQAEVDKWETFLNRDELKHRLSARYIYEHWYLANIYFADVERGQFFKLVRSSTPPGEAIQVIATRRPYEDPKVKRVYYRLQASHSTVLAKTNIPLLLNDGKLARLQQQFIDAEYQVTRLPGYSIEVASNPFKAFAAIPVRSRYQFMLDEAELIIRGFIQGPVCRGQIALNVINDQFWVAFVDPQFIGAEQFEQFLERHEDTLDMPAQEQSNALPISSWVKYAAKQSEFLEAKAALANEVFADGQHLTPDLLWQGEGYNDNAALTIFRHFNSATVVKGWVGEAPKTAWILDYSLFERIHYLLVAGFDVYGNVGHQLLTRLYMDFLRMEGEDNFLSLLPLEERAQLRAHWYRRSPKSLVEFLKDSDIRFTQPSGISYSSDDMQQELYRKLAAKLEPVLSKRYDYRQVPEVLQRLNALDSKAVNLLPQVSYILVGDKESEYQAYTLVHHNAHYNISSLLREEAQRAYDEDKALVVPGFIGDYPEALWVLSEEQLTAFVQGLEQVRNEQQYRALKSRFAVRRSDPDFWRYSDLLHQVSKRYRGIEYGLFDYNRLENR